MPALCATCAVLIAGSLRYSQSITAPWNVGKRALFDQISLEVSVIHILGCSTIDGRALLAPFAVRMTTPPSSARDELSGVHHHRHSLSMRTKT
jgi:hypothetical protein